MERVNLFDIDIGYVHFSKLSVFLDDDKKIIVLPLLWLTHLYNTGTVYGWHTRSQAKNSFLRSGSSKPSRYFKSRDVSDNTIENYAGHVFHFLKYINDLNKSTGTPSIHKTELITTRFVNYYLNSVLVQHLQSHASLVAHQSSISSYLNFLYNHEIVDYLPSTIYRKTRQFLAEKDTRHNKISYVSRSERMQLLQLCSTERDRLILRMGFEVGLRTSENKGLILDDFKARKISNPGLLTLFSELEKKPSKHSFEYVLSGKYTKGSKTRNIYFTRELLLTMKRYHDTERFLVTKLSGKNSNSLFLRTDNAGAGLPIGESHASNTFNKLLIKIPFINLMLSYHDLRHTFATELYHLELLDAQGQETRSESAALIVVSERLGHKNITTTHRYIRLRQQMLTLEEGE